VVLMPATIGVLDRQGEGWGAVQTIFGFTPM
jgi:hypothetical protein